MAARAGLGVPWAARPRFGAPGAPKRGGPPCSAMTLRASGSAARCREVPSMPLPHDPDQRPTTAMPAAEPNIHELPTIDPDGESTHQANPDDKLPDLA